VIRFRCGRCAEWVIASREQAGQPVACRRCGHTNVCPESPAPPVRPGARAWTPAPRGWLRGVVAAMTVASVAWCLWSVVASWRARAADATPVNPVDARQHEILEQDIDRPGDPLLMAAYQQINVAHFGGSLPALSVQWEPRLAEVGALAAETFTLEGMFGHIGRRAAILLNPDLQGHDAALTRALCHEMVHAYLYSTGDTTTNHGPAFQAVLRRLADEGAFEGIVATDAERAELKAWLDAESARLDAERADMDREAAEIARERADVEAALADLNARMAAASGSGGAGPDRGDIDEIGARRDAYNQRASEANARAERDQAALAEFNRQVARYNLMLSYPDGRDEDGFVKPKPAGPQGAAR